MLRYLFTVCIALAASYGAWAQTLLQTIQVSGNERIETSTILSYLGVREGDYYTPSDTSETIRKLYATGLFDHVQLRWDSGTLFVEVKENPLVNKVVFEGNDALDSDQLKTEISLHPRAVYTSGKVQQDVSALLNAYRKTGRYLAQVQPQIIKRDQNRVDVIYEIEEGEKTKIQGIKFIGNRRFSDGDLTNVILTKESAWWRFLSSSDVYDADRLEVDKQMLRRFYLSRGHAEFEVLSAVTGMSQDKKSFFVTFNINEGSLYDFGTLDVALNADEPDVNMDDLRQKLFIEQGQRYNAELVENNIDILVNHLGANGFAFLDVQPDMRLNDASRTIDITFNVTPGPRVYVNRINIKGNNRTQDQVIRREMRFAEGDVFSSRKLERSRDRLTYLGYFEDVNVSRQPTEFPDRMDLDVEVKEQSTGEFNVGAGFSSEEGALATTDIRERNFLGKGQDVLLSFALSGLRQDFNFSYTDPWFGGQERAAGIDLFNERRDFQSESSYDLGNVGGNLRYGFPVGEYSRNFLRFGLKETEVSNVDTGASAFVKREEGKKSGLSLGNTFTIDTRDSAIMPTKGYRLSLTGEYSGFGTDIDYLRGQVNGSWHHEVRDGWVLSLGGRMGAITDLGEDLPLFENFQAGGTTLRGFDRSGIGPRDRATNDALGGRYLVGNNAELSFPLPIMEDLGMNGLFFIDGGMVTEFDGNSSVVQDSRIYRIAAGTGVFWSSPLGPLRFEFGFPLVKASEDQTQIFSFSFGTRF